MKWLKCKRLVDNPVSPHESLWSWCLLGAVCHCELQRQPTPIDADISWLIAAREWTPSISIFFFVLHSYSKIFSFDFVSNVGLSAFAYLHLRFIRLFIHSDLLLCGEQRLSTLESKQFYHSNCVLIKYLWLRHKGKMWKEIIFRVLRSLLLLWVNKLIQEILYQNNL